MSDEPDAPYRLAARMGEPREKFEYMDEIRDSTDMEPKPIDGGGVDVGFGPFDALAHRHRDRGTDKSEADNE